MSPDDYVEDVSSQVDTLAATGERKVTRVSAPDGPVIGGSLGRLTLLRVLGSGGMGIVYEALDPSLGRRVAVKVMHADVATHDLLRARFLKEARITAELEHPGIVPVHDLFTTEEGIVCLVMRSISGASLAEVIADLRDGEAEAEARWTRARLLRAFLQVCEAIGFSHSRDVIHRDLKPANIMLGPFGETLILDWGVACRVGQIHPPDTRLTPSEGALLGTPGYMSPEQARGKLDLDPRSDVWSLGSILYELLTYEPAYRGNFPMQILMKSMEGAPTRPPERAPRLGIPDELTNICTKALEVDPADRYQSANELAAAIGTFLEGTRQRQAAVRYLHHARGVWRTYIELGHERAELMASEKMYADASDSWAPVSERRSLMEIRDTIDDLELRRARTFGEFISTSEKALAHVPDHSGARAALAAGYWERLNEAEAERDHARVAYFHDRVSAFDDGTYSELLRGTGSVTLQTEPEGAEVTCQRFETRGLVYPLSGPRLLGTTPLERVPLEIGSYRLTIRAPGYPDTRYPVHIERCRHWSTGEVTIRLQTSAATREGFCYVPAGPYLSGGDSDAPGSGPRREIFLDPFFIARFPVTVADYIEFLDAIHVDDPAEAWRRCPRSESSLNASTGQYFQRPKRGERYTLPEQSADEYEWELDWPVFGISWHDAVAYVEWKSAKDDVPYRLPLEHEVEKAMRGVDGRFYPWGDRFDRTLCKMGDSRRGPPRPEPVGAFPNDISIYGVRDLAGSMRDWCADAAFDGDTTLRPVRGGSWNYDPRFCRAACRLGRAPWRIFAYNGFRLARDA